MSMADHAFDFAGNQIWVDSTVRFVDSPIRWRVARIGTVLPSGRVQLWLWSREGTAVAYPDEVIREC